MFSFLLPRDIPDADGDGLGDIFDSPWVLYLQFFRIFVFLSHSTWSCRNAVQWMVTSVIYSLALCRRNFKARFEFQSKGMLNTGGLPWLVIFLHRGLSSVLFLSSWIGITDSLLVPRVSIPESKACHGHRISKNAWWSWRTPKERQVMDCWCIL